MARIRTIKPEFFTDEEIARLPPLYRLAFEGLWCHADKAGRLEDRPARLKVLILPYDNVDFGDVLHELAATRFVTRYAGPDGRAYLQIRSFEKHQRPRPDEPASEMPAPPTDLDSETTPSLFGDEPVSAQALGKEGNGKEGNGSGSAEVSAPSSPTDQAFLEYPVVGVNTIPFQLLEVQVADWTRLFPGLDVRQELRNALAWVLANPGRRKTSSGMLKFLASWLTRSNDRPRGPRPVVDTGAAANSPDPTSTQAKRRYGGMKFGK